MFDEEDIFADSSLEELDFLLHEGEDTDDLSLEDGDLSLGGLTSLDDLSLSEEDIATVSVNEPQPIRVSSQSEEEKEYGNPETGQEVDLSVKRYAEVAMEYPFLMLKGDIEIKESQLMALTKMTEASIGLSNSISLYVPNGDEILSIGKVVKEQVKALIDILGRDNITAVYREGQVLEGDMIYILC